MAATATKPETVTPANAATPPKPVTLTKWGDDVESLVSGKFTLRADFRQVIIRVLDDQERKITNGARAKRKGEWNRAEKTWQDYSAKHGRALEILGRAVTAEQVADADIERLETALTTAQGLTDAAKRAKAIDAAQSALTDARQRSANASDTAAQLRAMLGSDVHATYQEYRDALWAKVEEQNKIIRQLGKWRSKVLTLGPAKLTPDMVLGWNEIVPLSKLSEAERLREAKRAGLLIEDVAKITESALDLLDKFDAK